MINLQVGKPLTFKLPNLYRYMNQEHIDRFFEEGIIRISSFDKFRKYPDEIRGDNSEGGGAVFSKPDNGPKQEIITNVGDNGYMLSTSLLHSDEIGKQFKTNGVFLIKKPMEFVTAIADAILGVDQMFLGFCNYQDNRFIIKNTGATSMIDEKGGISIGGPNMAKGYSEIIGNGADLMYLKSNNYQSQSEFRFVWTIKSQFFKMKEYIDIECKEAIKFCEKIT